MAKQQPGSDRRNTCAACGSGDHESCSGKVQPSVDKTVRRECTCGKRNHEPGCPAS
jgi:hypothetical protein